MLSRQLDLPGVLAPLLARIQRNLRDVVSRL